MAVPSALAVGSPHAHGAYTSLIAPVFRVRQVCVDLDAPWQEHDAPGGSDAAWSGRVLTPTALRATVASTPRIATGIPTLGMRSFARPVV
jgi:hypothetical protein